MKRKRELLGACVAALCLYGYAGTVCAGEIQNFSFTNLVDEKQYCLSDFRGCEIVMIFGSIYCRPCIGLLPVMNKFYLENKDKRIVVIGVDVDSTTESEKIKKFTADQKISFPFFIDKEKIAKKYKVFMLPSVLFLDGNGKIKKKILGPKPLKVYLKELNKVKCRAAAREHDVDNS